MKNKKGKKYRTLKYDKNKLYPIKEALKMIADHPIATFDESIDVSVHLSVDTQQANQQVKGMVELPNGLGKKFVLLFLQKEKKKRKLAKLKRIMLEVKI